MADTKTVRGNAAAVPADTGAEGSSPSPGTNPSGVTQRVWKTKAELMLEYESASVLSRSNMKTFTPNCEEIRGLCSNFKETTWGAAAYVCELLNHAYADGRKDNEVLQKEIDTRVMLVIYDRDNKESAKARDAIHQLEVVKYHLKEFCGSIGLKVEP